MAGLDQRQRGARQVTLRPAPVPFHALTQCLRQRLQRFDCIVVHILASPHGLSQFEQGCSRDSPGDCARADCLDLSVLVLQTCLQLWPQRHLRLPTTQSKGQRAKGSWQRLRSLRTAEFGRAEASLRQLLEDLREPLSQGGLQKRGEALGARRWALGVIRSPLRPSA